jgi:succinate-semialdehyde dehydrogenase/glutarate-semialdehyde dehydrogenase
LEFRINLLTSKAFIFQQFENRMSLKSINPFSNKLIEEFEELSENEIAAIPGRSAIASETWKAVDLMDRISVISEVSATLRNNREEFAQAITSEMGKPVKESKAEVEKCAWLCDYYSENARTFLAREDISTDAAISYVSYEPLGTILGIMPWNFPFWQVFRFAVPALLAGNAVLLKHASNVQICARHIERIFRQAGCPGYTFINIVAGSSHIGKLIENDIIRGVSLTGSEPAGRKVAESAGRNIKKTVLELGGSNAFIVLDDADIEDAAETGVKARMANAGQSCIAAKRFIVHEKVSRHFIDIFTEKAKKIRLGDPMDENTGMGPLSSMKQAETIENQVTGSVLKGARVITGGKREDAFYLPTVLTGVKPGMQVFDEEVFGPVAAITVVRNAEEAISLANDTKFGLGITIFTSDTGKAAKMAGRFKDGAVFVNELVKSDPRLPFGGSWYSGYGRELAFHGIREFVNVKTVYIK